MKIQHTRLTVPVDGATLCLHRFKQPDAQGPAVLMVHGMMSNGRVFYSHSGKGLAPWLAERGYDVFVADLRGKGDSQPLIDRHAKHGQSEMIGVDLPALHAAVLHHAQASQVHWVSHSWGGVVMNSCLLRRPELIEQVASVVHFAAKRRVRVRNLHKRVEIDLLLNRVLKRVTHWAGYLPAKQLRIGADNETRKTHRQVRAWVQADPWVDSDDGFDYGQAAQHTQLPPTLYLAAIDDPCRGNPEDVKRFRSESGAHLSRVHVLSKRGGAKHDYNHLSIVTHPDAASDQFMLAQAWMEGRHDAVPDRG
jgi:predicted alpha/beta hydrolase